MKNNIKPAVMASNLLMIVLMTVILLALPGAAVAQADLSKLLKVENQIPADCGEYKLTVQTGNAEGAGTYANVYLTITGTNGDTGELALNSSKSPQARPSLDRTSRESSRCEKDGYAFKLVRPFNQDNFTDNFFERKSNHPFTVYGHNVGGIQSITIRTDNFGAGPAWLLSDITLVHGNKTFKFPINKWIEGNSLNTFTPRGENDRVADYTVTIKTGDNTGAGTDANISLQIEGFASWGDVYTGFQSKAVTIDKFILNGIMTGNVFERNQIDTVMLKNRPYVENIYRIIVSSDDSYSGSAWYVEWIVISWRNRFGGTTTARFQCHTWLQSGSLSATFKPDPQ